MDRVEFIVRRMTFLKLSDQDEEASHEGNRDNIPQTADVIGNMKKSVDTRSPTVSNTDSNSRRGCHLTREDIPNIVHSVVCSLAYLIYGAGASSLGASLPSVAREYQYDSSTVGILFTSRGVGYVAGTCTAAYILNLSHLSLTKEFLTCLFLVGSGIMAFGIATIHQFIMMNVMFLFQGFCFGAIEAIANCALPSMWGKRVQPWIQAMFACYGIGSMLGPVMVGAMNYHVAYVIIAILSFLPILLLVYYDTMRQQGYSRQLDKYCLCFLTIPHPAVSGRSDGMSIFSSIEIESTLHKHTHEHITTDEEEESSDMEETPDDSSILQDDPVVAPFYLTAILAWFMFFYVGIEVGFSGWITAYAIDEHITTSNSDAAYLSSIFWTAMTFGRMLAVVIAIYIKANTMIKVLLGFALLSTFFSVTIMTISYSITAFVCALLGLAMSALFPLMITIMVDYGFKM